MNTLFNLYDQFLNIFPDSIHGVISFILAVLLVVAIFQTLKKNFIWLIVLIILLPASIPILKSVATSLINLIKFLIDKF